MAIIGPPRYAEMLPSTFIYGVLIRGNEIQSCLRSKCDTYILKVELIMMHLGFILGFASASLFLHEILRVLLTRAVNGLGPLLDEHPFVEWILRSTLQILESKKLGKGIWDFVRDYCICMRFNNCRGDFFGQLNNIKLHVCDVQDPFNDRRRITTCEQLFNDSPLIALALGMIVLAMIAFVQNQPPPAPGQPAQPPAAVPPAN